MDDSAVSTEAASRGGVSRGLLIHATVLLCLVNMFNALDRGALLLIGYLSDALAPALGDESLRYAMIIGVTVIGWGAIHFFIAAKHFSNELVS